MHWHASGTTNQSVMFKLPAGAVPDTVESIKDGAAPLTWTTPTLTANAGLGNDGTLIYELLLDEDVTCAAGNETEHLMIVVSGAGMGDQELEVTLFRPELMSAVDANGNVPANVVDVLTSGTLQEGGAAPGGGPIGY